MEFTLSKEFGYVIGVAAASYVVHNMWMGMQVVAARRKFKVSYPDMYATPENCSDEKSRNHFNCVQRAHQNSLEGYPAFLALLLVAGVQHPVTSASLGGVYLLGRILYFLGYSTGKPDARYRGGFLHLGMLGLTGVALKTAFNLLMSR